MAKKNNLTVPQTINWDKKPNRKYFLNYLIQKYNLKVMAEVGVRDGRTTFFLLDHNPELKIYAIDKSIAGFFSPEIQKKYGNRLVFLEQLSDTGHQYIHELLDLVFIDADHSYEAVKKDIKNYSTKLKNTGWLTGHDIDFPGVNKAVKELIVGYDVGPNNVWIKKPYGIKDIIDEN